MSAVSVSWAISAHDRQRVIRQVSRSGACPLQHPPRGLDVHALDHLVVEALGAAVEGGDECPGARDLGGARREGPMTERDLVRMDQALAVETEAPPLLRLPQEAIGIVEAVEDAIERRDAR